MIRGRKPKPSLVHLINGNPGKRPRSRVHPKAPRGIPPPFAHLSQKMKDAWMEIGRIVDMQKICTLGHGHALELLCGELVEVRELRDEIEKHGRFQNVRTTNGSKKRVISPAVIALSDAEKRLRAMYEQFGMTPTAETRVNAKEDEDGEKDPAEGYFGPRLVPPNRKK